MAVLKVSIAGAGIAGLASAIALARHDHEVTIHEQASRIESVGAGLQLGPNAVRVLQALGIWEKLESQCVAPARIRICDAANGKQLSMLELGENFERQFGAPYRVAHRADLINALELAVSGHENINLNLGSRITGMHSGPEPHLKLMASEPEPADLIVAADGIRSSLRSLIRPDAAPRPSGQTLYRALAPASALPQSLDPQAVYLWLAPGGHVVHYLVSGGRRLNMVASIDQQDDLPGWNGPASRSTVLAAFASTAQQLQACLEAPASWLAWTGADIEPFLGWHNGTSVLVGDAAHGSLPYLAQGAAMALEDAAALAKHIKAGPGLTTCLAAFEAERQPRTARITLESRRNGKIYHMAGAPAVARNLALRTMPAASQIKRLGWIYQY